LLLPGDHLVNPDCVSKNTSAADLYYSKVLAFALLPLFAILIAFVFWFSVGLCKGVSFFEKRTTPTSTTLKDKFVITVTSIVYLLYPTLVANAFGVFECQRVGATIYFSVDLNEKCFVGKHLTMVFILGVGQLILYVFGLPLLVLLLLKKNKENLGNHVSMSRFGLFYASFKPSRYFWESIITARKIAIVALARFGDKMGPVKQSQVALLILVICLVLEILGTPFVESTPRHHILGWLELASLLCQWWTMWSGSMLYQLNSTTEEVYGVVLTFSVILVNGTMMVWFVFTLVREKKYEIQQSRREAATNTIAMRSVSFRDSIVKGMSSLRSLVRNRRSVGSKDDIEMTSVANPVLHDDVKELVERAEGQARRKSERKIKMQKIRQRLSISPRTKRINSERVKRGTTPKNELNIVVVGEELGNGERKTVLLERSRGEVKIEGLVEQFEENGLEREIEDEVVPVSQYPPVLC
jgi:hypothetical protein